MSIGIIGRKLGMTQIYDPKGQLVSVTVIKAGPCPITQLKTKEKDGYSAIQIGFSEAGRKKNSKKPYKGHFKASNVTPVDVLKEVKVESLDNYKLGDQLTIESFLNKNVVDVIGFSKGRGFTGVMKRYGFAGKDSGHGTHEYFRHGGSIGCRTPKHTIRGMRMPGRMGNKRKTTRNLQILFVDLDNNLLLLKGAIPGWNGAYVFVREAILKK
jgi:large subunit ribosomal protein L3